MFPQALCCMPNIHYAFYALAAVSLCLFNRRYVALRTFALVQTVSTAVRRFRSPVLSICTAFIPDSIKTFRLQKRIIRIMAGCRYRDSCRKLFINLEILPLPSQYILSLLMFMIRSQFVANSEMHHINTRQHANSTHLL